MINTNLSNLPIPQHDGSNEFRILAEEKYDCRGKTKQNESSWFIVKFFRAIFTSPQKLGIKASEKKPFFGRVIEFKQGDKTYYLNRTSAINFLKANVLQNQDFAEDKKILDALTNHFVSSNTTTDKAAAQGAGILNPQTPQNEAGKQDPQNSGNLPLASPSSGARSDPSKIPHDQKPSASEPKPQEQALQEVQTNQKEPDERIEPDEQELIQQGKQIQQDKQQKAARKQNKAVQRQQNDVPPENQKKTEQQSVDQSAGTGKTPFSEELVSTRLKYEDTVGWEIVKSKKQKKLERKAKQFQQAATQEAKRKEDAAKKEAQKKKPPEKLVALKEDSAVIRQPRERVNTNVTSAQEIATQQGAEIQTGAVPPSPSEKSPLSDGGPSTISSERQIESESRQPDKKPSSVPQGEDVPATSGQTTATKPLSPIPTEGAPRLALTRVVGRLSSPAKKPVTTKKVLALALVAFGGLGGLVGSIQASPAGSNTSGDSNAFGTDPNATAGVIPDASSIDPNASHTYIPVNTSLEIVTTPTAFSDTCAAICTWADFVFSPEGLNTATASAQTPPVVEPKILSQEELEAEKIKTLDYMRDLDPTEGWNFIKEAMNKQDPVSEFVIQEFFSMLPIARTEYLSNEISNLEYVEECIGKENSVCQKLVNEAYLKLRGIDNTVANEFAEKCIGLEDPTSQFIVLETHKFLKTTDPFRAIQFAKLCVGHTDRASQNIVTNTIARLPEARNSNVPENEIRSFATKCVGHDDAASQFVATSYLSRALEENLFPLDYIKQAVGATNQASQIIVKKGFENLLVRYVDSYLGGDIYKILDLAKTCSHKTDPSSQYVTKEAYKFLSEKNGNLAAGLVQELAGQLDETSQNLVEDFINKFMVPGANIDYSSVEAVIARCVGKEDPASQKLVKKAYDWTMGDSRVARPNKLASMCMNKKDDASKEVLEKALDWMLKHTPQDVIKYTQASTADPDEFSQLILNKAFDGLKVKFQPEAFKLAQSYIGKEDSVSQAIVKEAFNMCLDPENSLNSQNIRNFADKSLDTNDLASQYVILTYYDWMVTKGDSTREFALKCKGKPNEACQDVIIKTFDQMVSSGITDNIYNFAKEFASETDPASQYVVKKAYDYLKEKRVGYASLLAQTYIGKEDAISQGVVREYFNKLLQGKAEEVKNDILSFSEECIGKKDEASQEIMMQTYDWIVNTLRQDPTALAKGCMKYEDPSSIKIVKQSFDWVVLNRKGDLLVAIQPFENACANYKNEASEYMAKRVFDIVNQKNPSRAIKLAISFIGRKEESYQNIVEEAYLSIQSDSSRLDFARECLKHDDEASKKIVAEASDLADQILGSSALRSRRGYASKFKTAYKANVKNGD